MKPEREYSLMEAVVNAMENSFDSFVEYREKDSFLEFIDALKSCGYKIVKEG